MVEIPQRVAVPNPLSKTNQVPVANGQLFDGDASGPAVDSNPSTAGVN